MSPADQARIDTWKRWKGVVLLAPKGYRIRHAWCGTRMIAVLEQFFKRGYVRESPFVRVEIHVPPGGGWGIVEQLAPFEFPEKRP